MWGGECWVPDSAVVEWTVLHLIPTREREGGHHETEHPHSNFRDPWGVLCDDIEVIESTNVNGDSLLLIDGSVFQLLPNYCSRHRQCFHTMPAPKQLDKLWLGKAPLQQMLSKVMGNEHHGNWNHCPCQYAPQPHAPGASDHTLVSELSVHTCMGRRIETLFQDWMKVYHHSMSAWNSRLRRTV